MRLTKRIKGVADFKIIEKELLYLRKNTSKKTETLVVKNFQVELKRFNYFTLFKGFFYYGELDGGHFRQSVDGKNQIIKVSPYSVHNSGVVYLDNEDNYSYSNDHLENKEILYEYIDICRYTVFDDFLYTDMFSDVVVKYDIENAEEVWRFELRDLPEFELGEDESKRQLGVSQYLGLVDGVLWVELGDFRVLGLNVETGELVHCVCFVDSENVHNGEFEYYVHNKPTGCRFLLDGTKLKGIGIGRVYWEIDLTNEKPFLEAWCLDVELDKFPELDGYFQLSDHCLITDTDDLIVADRRISRWFIFDTSTKTIKWVSDKLDITRSELGGSINKIVYDSGKVYILDFGDTLHIFEKN